MRIRHLFLLLLPLAGALSALADEPHTGVVSITADRNLTSVKVTGSPNELAGLAQRAFSAHGAYRLVADDAAYNLNFTLVGSAQVRVDITRGSAGLPVFSETVGGTSTRNALLRAADVAVTHTSKERRGFFAGKLAFISDRGAGMEIMTSDLFGGEVVGWPGVSRQILSRALVAGRQEADLHQLSQRVSRYLCARSRHPPAPAPGQRAGHQHRRAFQPRRRPDRHGAERRREFRNLRRERGGTDDFAAHPQSRSQSQPMLVTRRHAVDFYVRAGAAVVFMPAAAGAFPQRLTSGISRYCAEPDWCRWDPSKIAFTVAEGRGYQIAVYDFSAGQAEVVSQAPLDAIEPCWLADGRHLIYTAREANQRRLILFDTETKRATPISPTALGKCSQASYWIQ